MIDSQGPCSCIQMTLPATSSLPPIHLQVVFMYPATSLMIWFSISGSGVMGSTSMALPMPTHMPPSSTRLDGFSASDTSDRLATLLCRKYGRQVFVSCHLPRRETHMIQGTDGASAGEDVIVRAVLAEIHKIVVQEGQTLREKHGTVASREETTQGSVSTALNQLVL